jgi:hypothetical protein
MEKKAENEIQETANQNKKRAEYFFATEKRKKRSDFNLM